MSTQAPVFVVDSFVIAAAHPRRYPKALVDPSVVPQLAVKRWRPASDLGASPGDPSFILIGGIGIIKEAYEPFIHDLTLALAKQGTNVRAFWICDPIHTGQSALLNGSNLGSDSHPIDHGFDVLRMIQHFEISDPLVGLSECFGSMQLAWLAGIHRSLFSGIVCIDPNINLGTGEGDGGQFLAAMCRNISRRREYWSTRAEAENSILQNPYYRNFDRRCIQQLLAHSFCPIESAPSTEIPEGEIKRLTGKGFAKTTPRAQELHQILRSHPKGDAIEEWARTGKAPTGNQFLPHALMDLTKTSDSTLQSQAVRSLSHPKLPFGTFNPQPVTLNSPHEPLGDEWRPWLLHAHFECFAALPWIACPTFYISATKSWFSTPSDRVARLHLTGSSIFGSGAYAAGQVREHCLQGADHDALFSKEFMPEIVTVSSTWIHDCVRKWTEREDSLNNWRRRAITPAGRIQQTTSDIRLLESLKQWNSTTHIRDIVREKMQSSNYNYLKVKL